MNLVLLLVALIGVDRACRPADSERSVDLQPKTTAAPTSTISRVSRPR